jgi:hypothetical protein
MAALDWSHCSAVEQVPGQARRIALAGFVLAVTALASVSSATAQSKPFSLGDLPTLAHDAGSVVRLCEERAGPARFIEQTVGHSRLGVLICDAGSGIYITLIAVYKRESDGWRLLATRAARTNAARVSAAVVSDRERRLRIQDESGRELLSLSAAGLIDESTRSVPK